MTRTAPTQPDALDRVLHADRAQQATRVTDAGLYDFGDEDPPFTTRIRQALDDGGILPHRYRITPCGGDPYNRPRVSITDTHLICRQPLLDAQYTGAGFQVDPGGLYSFYVADTTGA